MRSLWIAASAAVLALAAAAWVWRAGEQRAVAPGEVTVVACAPDALDALQTRHDGKTVTVRFAEDGAWIDVDAPKRGAVAPPGGVTPTELRSMAASDAIERLRESFGPLRARRSLGRVADAKLGALGLAAPSGTLTVGCGGRQAVLELGDAAYGGAGRYARDAQTGEVVLLTESAVADVRLADVRFVQRALIDARPDALARLRLQADGREVTLEHLRRGQPNAALWVRAEAPDRRDEMIGNWVSAILQLRALEHLGRGVEPGVDSGEAPGAVAEPLWRATVTLGDGSAATLELRRIAAVDGQPARYFARSDATRGWVTLSTQAAQRVSDDVPALVGP